VYSLPFTITVYLAFIVSLPFVVSFAVTGDTIRYRYLYVKRYVLFTLFYFIAITFRSISIGSNCRFVIASARGVFALFVALPLANILLYPHGAAIQTTETPASFDPATL
jgi:hypothetical protein